MNEKLLGLFEAYVRAFVSFGLGVLVVGVAFAGCGKPTDSLKFKAPMKFGNARNVMGLAQVWETSDKKEVLLLAKLPFSADSNNVLQTPTLKDARLEKKEQIKICGNQPATRLAVSKRSEGLRMDAVAKPVGGVTYLAIYGYPQRAKPDPLAETAIRDLCEK